MKSTPRCGYLAWIQVASTRLTRFKIEEALNRTLALCFMSVASRTMIVCAEFYYKCKGGADEYDKDFTKKYCEELNATLIFVSEVFVWHTERK